MELFICFFVNHQNILPLCVPHFPRGSASSIQSGFVTSSQILICHSLCPPSFAKCHAKVSTLFSCSPTLPASPETSRVVTTACPPLILALLPTFQQQLQPLARHQQPPEVPTKEATPLHSRAFPFFATVHYAQFLKQEHQSSWCSEANPHMHGGGCPQVSTWPTPPHIKVSNQFGNSLRAASSTKPFSLMPGWLPNCWFKK